MGARVVEQARLVHEELLDRRAVDAGEVDAMYALSLLSVVALVRA